MFVFETKRLILRELEVTDAAHFYALNADPAVLRYTGDLPFASIEDAAFFLKNYKAYTRRGLGRWAVLHKKNHAFLGWCGLKYDAQNHEVDIGFRFFKKYWNRGYASEAAQASLAFAFLEKNLPFVVGRAMTANRASIRVLEKLGLIFWKKTEMEGHEALVYRINSPF